MFEKLFKLNENRTTVKTEVIAGITTFMTMAYILAVNPTILSDTGMDKGAVFTATALASLLGTVCMAFFANYPFAIAPGMGLNAYFAYSVVLGMGYSWQTALAAVFIEGIIFILLSLFSVREAIFNSIPTNLKYAVSVGIGLFITFIGMQNAKLVVKNDATLVGLTSYDTFTNEAGEVIASFNDVGITTLLTIIGVIITAVLIIKNVKGGILWGILITYLLGIVCQLTRIYIPNPELSLYSLYPDFSNGLMPSSLEPILFKFDFQNILTFEFVVIVFAFLFVDLFDTLGTLIGVASKADMLDKNGKLPRIKGALLADALSTTTGAALGTSTTTTYVESASGVLAGGRTGLTALITAGLFGISIFFSPIFLAIPSFATAPALIIVGFYMIASIMKINFSDMTEGIPAFITIIAMPFMYSISEGIAMGFVSYVVINVLSGLAGKKKITIVMYILALLFVLKYVFL